MKIHVKEGKEETGESKRRGSPMPNSIDSVRIINLENSIVIYQPLLD